jgi:hypothetical protein
VGRRLFTLASAVSLVLFLGTVTVWGKSFWRGEFVSWDVGPMRPDALTVRRVSYTVTTGRAGLVFSRIVDDIKGEPGLDTKEAMDQLQAIFRSRPRPLKWDHSLDPTVAGWGFADIETPYSDAAHRGVSWILYVNKPRTAPYPTSQLAIRFWLPTAAFALLPLLRLRKWRHTRTSRRAETCPRCGYDLRATPDRCPECGTPVKKPADTPATAPSTPPSASQSAPP